VQWHKFSFGRNITETAETVKLAFTVTLWQSGSQVTGCRGQDGAYASWYRRPET